METTTNYQSNQIQKWTAKNSEKISRSKEHKDMFIVDYPDGKFITVHSTTEQMIERHKIKVSVCQPNDCYWPNCTCPKPPKS